MNRGATGVPGGTGARTPRLLLLSNGHGEDFIAARLGEGLRARLPDLRMDAFPLVGLGTQLAAAGLHVVGPTRRLPADGFTLHHPRLLAADLRAGLLQLTLAQARFLRRARPAAVLVVGDYYAQLHASLTGAPRRVLQPLVSVHHQERPVGERRPSPLRYFMESFRGPELALLRRADRVYARDAATASYLSGRGVAAAYLGNPMMDGLAAPPLEGLGPDAGRDVVALLPGSRAHAAESVRFMIGVLERVPAVHGLVAWLGDEVPEPPEGWEPEQAVTASVGGVRAAWRRPAGGQRVWWVEGRFASVLASARAVVGTTGTANEQAVGLGLPVVAFVVPPLYGADFVRNQARLLGRGLLVSKREPAAVAARLVEALRDERVRAAAKAAGAERMGLPGGSAALADDLAEWLAGLGLA